MHNQGDNRTQVDFAKSFDVRVETTARKMVKEKKDVGEIPESSGMVLVRIGSAAHRLRRAKSNPQVMIVPMPVMVDDSYFFICES